jgi:CDP-diacylglycerol--glycerol-3-phosphate 3-phosphatidyltransferase
MTVTGFIGKACMWPLRAIIRACVALGIHPNTLTLIGVLINVVAACALGVNRFLLAGVIMIVANIFDFIDGKVAQETNTVSRFGAFWAPAYGLRDGRGAGDDVFDHDELRARPRRVADREV